MTLSTLIARLEEAEKKATPAPWAAEHRDVGNPDNDPAALPSSSLGWEINGPPEAWHRGQFQSGHDAVAIAESRNALPLLLALAREAVAWRTWCGTVNPNAFVRGQTVAETRAATDRIAAGMGVEIDLSPELRKEIET